MFDWRVAHTIQSDRQREIEGRMRVRRLLDGRPAARSRSIRRRVGMELIRIGTALAPDGRFEPAAR